MYLKKKLSIVPGFFTSSKRDNLSYMKRVLPCKCVLGVFRVQLGRACTPSLESLSCSSALPIYLKTLQSNNNIPFSVLICESENKCLIKYIQVTKNILKFKYCYVGKFTRDRLFA